MSDPDTTTPPSSPDAISDEEPERDDSEAPTESSSFLSAVRAPITAETPAGESVTYDEDFRTLKTQIDNIGSVSGTVDYEEITELARTILTEKSKDLRVAGYLAVGEAWTNGAGGMAEAIQAVRLLIDEYWDELYPPKRRMRGRGNALQFVSDRLGDWIAATDFEPSDRAALTTARDGLEHIQEFSLQEMGEDAPSLSGLLNDFEGAIDELPDPDTETEDSGSTSGEESADEEPGATGDEPPPSSTATISSTSDLATDSDALAVVREAATFLREKDPSNPIPYRLLRTVQWAPIREEPPSEAGETRIQSPREQRRSYLSGLLEDGKYETLVQEGESAFQAEPFHLWLDLQRLIASALDNLGAPYQTVYDAVMLDTARLIARLPTLPSLAFSDGTPFASPLTAEWIETQVRPLLAEDSEPDGTADRADQMPVQEQYEEARQQLSGGKLDEALALMREGAAEDTSEKESFHRRLYIATLCVKGDRPSIARPLLDDLCTDIEQHGLEDWDPSLALEVWSRQYQCYERLAQQASGEEQEDLSAEADAAFEKVCRVDAHKAISLADQRVKSTA